MRLKAFEFFKGKNEDNSAYFDELMNNLQNEKLLAYPEKFMTFINYFKIQNNFLQDYYFQEEIKRIYPLNQVIHFPSLENFVNIQPGDWVNSEEELLKELLDFEINDLFHDYGIILIGYTFEANERICLGITPQTCEQIWIVGNSFLDEAKTKEAIKVADNIFEYINGLGFTTPLQKIENLVKFQGDALWTDLEKNFSDDYKKAIKNTVPSIRCGFDFLYSREYLESSKIIVSKLRPILPEKYKFFLRYFSFLGSSGLKLEKFYDKNLNREIDMEEIAYLTPINNEKIVINKMYSESEILVSLEVNSSSNLSFLDIGITHQNEIIKIGLKGEYEEGIFLQKSNEIVKLATDIFDFVSGFISISKELPKIQLYKTWGESFWRELEGDALDFWKKREGIIE